MKAFALMALAIVGCLAFSNSADAWGGRVSLRQRVVVQRQVIRQPVVFRQRAAIVVPRQQFIVPQQQIVVPQFHPHPQTIIIAP